MPWYKLVRPDGTDFYSGSLRYDVGAVVECPDYTDAPVCGHGLHISARPNDAFVGARIPCRALRVEPIDGLVTIDDRKSKCRRLHVVVEEPDLNVLFGWDYTGAIQFLEALRGYSWFRPDGAPDPSWCLSQADTWTAAREAARTAARTAGWTIAWEAARDAARDAVGTAAWEAAWEAAGTAARTAAWEAARTAARDVAWDAAREAAWEAAGGVWRTAALAMVMRYVCAGLAIPTAHRAYVDARLRVWQKGYAVHGEVAGTLYVYGVRTA